jgi:small multidrug resistance pump
VPYVYLLLAIAVEVLATSLLKLSDGFTKLWPTVGSLAGYGVAFVLLAVVVRHMPVGVAYAVWAGLGTAAIAAVGVVFLDESLTFAKIAGIVLVIGGVVTLNLGGAH